MPRTFGDGLVHSSHFEAMAQTDRPIYEKPQGQPDPAETRIGQIIAENLVENGATLQLGRSTARVEFAGIGAIPDMTLAAMKHHKDLGVHTELICDGVIDLIEKGVINNEMKSIMSGKVGRASTEPFSASPRSPSARADSTIFSTIIHCFVSFSKTAKICATHGYRTFQTSPLPASRTLSRSFAGNRA